MAMMDDRNFLLMHIRNSFITSDDTGMCEVVIENFDHGIDRTLSFCERPPASVSPYKTASKTEGVSSDSEIEADNLPNSYDIMPDMDLDSHRRRSNTAVRLEKLKREKQKQSKIRHIQWKSGPPVVSEQKSEIFEKKDVEKGANRSRRSLLSMEMEQSVDGTNNPFMEFAKFDGRTAGSQQTKKVEIFLTMLPANDRPFPMTVITMASAKVQDLIGLICWQYTMEQRQPPLRTNSDAYVLQIAEDDGDVDMDFPALDNHEPISKFGFSKLALVEKASSSLVSDQSILVTVAHPDHGFSKFTVDSMSVTMREILNIVLKKRRLKQVPGLEYHLEKQDEPGVAVDLDLSLSALRTTDFCLLRANSSRRRSETDIPDGMSAMAQSLTSPQYKSYSVKEQHKLRANVDVNLGISGECIQIDPIGSRTLFRSKAVTYDIEDIASCAIHGDRHSSANLSFRLVYRSPLGYKHHDFECRADVAREIVQKVNSILELRLSDARWDYLQHRDKKIHHHSHGHGAHLDKLS